MCAGASETRPSAFATPQGAALLPHAPQGGWPRGWDGQSLKQDAQSPERAERGGAWRAHRPHCLPRARACVCVNGTHSHSHTRSHTQAHTRRSAQPGVPRQPAGLPRLPATGPSSATVLLQARDPMALPGPVAVGVKTDGSPRGARSSHEPLPLKPSGHRLSSRHPELALATRGSPRQDAAASPAPGLPRRPSACFLPLGRARPFMSGAAFEWPFG